MLSTEQCRHVASRKFFGGQGQVMEGQNFFYSDKHDGMKCLYQYYFCILIKTSRRVFYEFYEFIMGNKHKDLGLKAKL